MPRIGEAVLGRRRDQRPPAARTLDDAMSEGRVPLCLESKRKRQKERERERERERETSRGGRGEQSEHEKRGKGAREEEGGVAASTAGVEIVGESMA